MFVVQNKANNGRFEIVGTMAQLRACVNPRGTIHQTELILLCVHYASKRADYKIIFTEGSSVCVCVCGVKIIGNLSTFLIKKRLRISEMR